jgi:hypothetical protein
VTSILIDCLRVPLFGFADAHHHNQLFITPLTTAMSPLIHFASFATFLPVVALGILGLHRSSVIAFSITMLPNLTQHLGFDPLPWLTRANHYYFYGALPWIPLYHSYHHNPFVKTGNFGNTTVLFDYIYGTLQPECIYHIENGCMPEKVSIYLSIHNITFSTFMSLLVSNANFIPFVNFLFLTVCLFLACGEI